MTEEGWLGKGLIKTKGEKRIISSILFVPSLLSTVEVISQAKPLGEWWWWARVGWSGLLPTNSDLAVKHFLCWLKLLLYDPNKIGG